MCGRAASQAIYDAKVARDLPSANGATPVLALPFNIRSIARYRASGGMFGRVPSPSGWAFTLRAFGPCFPNGSAFSI
jgi:hypothetical protein